MNQSKGDATGYIKYVGAFAITSAVAALICKGIGNDSGFWAGLGFAIAGVIIIVIIAIYSVFGD